MGAIRKAEQARFAYLLNVLVSLLLPPTRPVDYMNYSSICSKQLGNYYCPNQINNSPCDVATTLQNLLTYPKENWKKEAQGEFTVCEARLHCCFFNSSHAMVSLFHFLLFSCLSLLQLHFSPSCVPLKDIHERRAAMVERVQACLNACPAITLCFYASFFL